MENTEQDIKVEKDKGVEFDATLSFTLDKEGNVYIYFSAKDENAELETLIAQLLFTVNSGGYTQDILRAIDDYQQNKPEAAEFVKNIILNWGAIINMAKEAQKDSGKNLVVKPTQFIQYSGYAGAKQ